MTNGDLKLVILDALNAQRDNFCRLVLVEPDDDPDSVDHPYISIKGEIDIDKLATVVSDYFARQQFSWKADLVNQFNSSLADTMHAHSAYAADFRARIAELEAEVVEVTEELLTKHNELVAYKWDAASKTTAPSTVLNDCIAELEDQLYTAKQPGIGYRMDTHPVWIGDGTEPWVPLCPECLSSAYDEETGSCICHNEELVNRLTTLADQADRGDVVTLTGMTDEEMMESLFGDAAKPGEGRGDGDT